MEAKFSWLLKKKRLLAIYHGGRVLVMLCFALLMFAWIAPPRSLFGDASVSLGVRMVRAFYDTAIAGQVLIILVFSTVMWPVQQLMLDFYGMYLISKKRITYRKQILKMPFSRSADSPLDNCF